MARTIGPWAESSSITSDGRSPVLCEVDEVSVMRNARSGGEEGLREAGASSVCLGQEALALLSGAHHCDDRVASVERPVARNGERLPRHSDTHLRDAHRGTIGTPEDVAARRQRDPLATR